MTEDTELLSALGDEFKRTPEVAEQFGHSRRWTAKKLKRLAEDGLVEKDKEGGNWRWKLTSDGKEALED